MTKKYSTPWEVGSLFICNKCGAKFNQPDLAESLKSSLRKVLKARDENKKIRVIVSGCLDVCYPEEQSFAFMPKSGETEVYTTQLDEKIAFDDIQKLINEKI